MSNYTTKNHGKFTLTVHIIFVCKYRKPLLVKYGQEIKHIICEVSTNRNWEIMEIEVDVNHIHILLKYSPNDSLVKIISLLKQMTTYRIWRQNENAKHLTQQFWKECTFWSDGYFVCSIGDVSKEIISKYIQNQG